MGLFYKLSIMMGVVVVASNYLVQYPIQKFGLDEILTYGAFSYPITFLFTIGILLTLFVSTNFSDIISIRIAIGSGLAFFIAQNLDVNIFDYLRKKVWFVAPLASSTLGSITDTLLFFSIAFYGTEVPWVTLAAGDLIVKMLITLMMLIPFRILLFKIKDYTDTSGSRIKL